VNRLRDVGGTRDNWVGGGGNRAGGGAVQGAMRTRAAFLLVFVLSAAACGDPGQPARASTSVDQAGEPWGRAFLSTSVTENDQPRPLVEGTRIRLTFSDDHHLGAQAGCNSMGGPAEISEGEDTRLVVGDLATTEMGCDPARHAQDDWLARFLTSRPTWQLDGPRLTLEQGGTRIELTDREVADPDRPLRGTRWVVDTIVGSQAASSVPAGAEAYLVFGDEGFTGSTGCNQMSGTSAVDSASGRITFSDVISTKMACDDDRMRLERAVVSVLDGQVAYDIEADRLRLDHPSGNGLGLRASD
jgi:heat shock protein HslJ